MSIQFERPLTEEQQESMKEMFGDRLAASDERVALLNDRNIYASEMKELANKTGQRVSVELNDNDDVKEMSDGTKYVVTPAGWKKINN